MKTHEQELKDLKNRYDLLVQAVHEMNELIHELGSENQQLREIIEELSNERI